MMMHKFFGFESALEAHHWAHKLILKRLKVFELTCESKEMSFSVKISRRHLDGGGTDTIGWVFLSVYNMTSNVEYNLQQLARLINEQIDSIIGVRDTEARIGNSKRYVK